MNLKINLGKLGHPDMDLPVTVPVINKEGEFIGGGLFT